MKQLYCIELTGGHRRTTTKYYQTKTAFDKAWKYHAKLTEYFRSTYGWDNAMRGYQLDITQETLVQAFPQYQPV